MARVDYRRAAIWCEELYARGLRYPAWTTDRADHWSESLCTFVEIFIHPKLPVPPFHRNWLYALCRYQYLCVLAPRDHAKSTVMGVYYPLWRIYMDHNTTMMLVAQSETIASLELGGVKNYIDGSPRLKAGFGDIAGDAKGWGSESFFIPRTDISLPHPTCVAIGVGSSVLSRRVTSGAVIADDLVRDDQVVTELQRRRTADWINNVLIPVVEANEQVVFVGTRKSESDFYAGLIEGKEMQTLSPFAVANEDTAEGYKVFIYDAQPDEMDPDNVLWPEKWSRPELDKRRATMGPIAYDRNYRNKVLTSETSIFPIEWFQKCYDYDATILSRHYGAELKKCLAVDLAIGSDEANSFFVAMIIGMEKTTGNFKLLWMTRKRCGALEQVRIVGELYDRFIPDWVVVEDNGYQRAFLEFVQASNIRVTPQPFHTDKRKHSTDEGIPSLQPIISAGRLRLPMANPESRAVSEIVVRELNHLGAGEKDDTVLTLWFATQRLMGKMTRREAKAIIV